MQERCYTIKDSLIEGTGLFATRDISKGAKIIQYVGRRLTKKQSDKLDDTRYLFELDDKYDLDGNILKNKAGFINHSCDPNCETENIDGEIWIVAIKDIKKGEELSYNYGYDLEDAKDYPCNCGSKNCVGYIVKEELWPELKKSLKEKDASLNSF